MFKKLIIVYLLLLSCLTRSDCTINPQAGENQWRMTARLGVCLDETSSLAEVIDENLLSIGDLLCSKIVDIDSTVVSLNETIIDTLSVVDMTVLLESVSEVLSSQIELLDTNCTLPLITFNADCDSNRQDFIAIQFNYGISDDLFNITSVGAGTTGETTGLVFLSTPDAPDSITVQTRNTVPVNVGDEVYGIFSAAFDRPDGASQQIIGLTNGTLGAGGSGMAVGYHATLPGTFAAMYFHSGTLLIPQASFNVDPLNGTGPSGFVFVPSNLNTFRLSYAWYGTVLLRYQILGSDGNWITFHEQLQVNNQVIANGPAFFKPDLHMTMTQTALAAGVDDQLFTTGWRAGVIRSGETNAATRLYAFDTIKTSVVGTETYMFTIQNATTFNGVFNTLMIRLLRLGGANALDNTTPTILRCYKNSTLTGAVFADIDLGLSVVEADTSATSFSGGNLLWMLGGTLEFENIQIEDPIEFYVAPGESLTITAEQITGAPIELYAAAVWEELQ